MAEYAFLSIWQLAAPAEVVWQVISNPKRYPEWWAYVAAVEELSPGDSSGAGTILRYRWTTALPYTFVFDARVTVIDPPRLLEAVAFGELEGLGRWELDEDGAGTTVRYTWKVRTTKLWMNIVAPSARPVFAWNHGVIMRAGGEGLARLLGVPLLWNESRALEDAPRRRGGSLAALLAVGAVIGAVAYRALRPRRG